MDDVEQFSRAQAQWCTAKSIFGKSAPKKFNVVRNQFCVDNVPYAGSQYDRCSGFLYRREVSGIFLIFRKRTAAV